MFEGLGKFFNKFKKAKDDDKTKNAAKERLHLVLMQDRANVSADFLELMKQEIIEVIKKYIDVDEKEIDVRLTNKPNADGTVGAPALYANIPIVSIKNEARKVGHVENKAEEKEQEAEPKEEPVKEEIETEEEPLVEKQEETAEEQVVAPKEEEVAEKEEDKKEEENSEKEEKA